jgi:hypothetical protein
MSSLGYNLRNQLEEVRAEIWWTGFLTILSIVASYLALRYTALPEQHFNIEKFAEIDFTKYVSPEPPMPKPKPLPREKSTVEAEPAPAAPSQEADANLVLFEALKQPVVAAPPTSPLHDATMKENVRFEAGKIDLAQQRIEIVGSAIGQNILKSTTAPPLQTKPALPKAIQLPHVRVTAGDQLEENLPPILHRSASLRGGAAPGKILQPAMPISRAVGGTGTGPAGTTRSPITEQATRVDEQGHEKTAQKIEVKNFANVDLKKIFKVLFLKLAEWLKQSQKELSPAVKHFMNYKQGDLTTVVLIDAHDQVYEWFIRCNEASEEVGILMAEMGENGEAIYLRDVGFKQQSHYLGIGQVGRNENGEVFTVSMREETPSREQTTRFYNIFLSWWKANNP